MKEIKAVLNQYRKMQLSFDEAVRRLERIYHRDKRKAYEEGYRAGYANGQDEMKEHILQHFASKENVS